MGLRVGIIIMTVEVPIPAGIRTPGFQFLANVATD